jgi:hypothetical protein
MTSFASSIFLEEMADPTDLKQNEQGMIKQYATMPHPINMICLRLNCLNYAVLNK